MPILATNIIESAFSPLISLFESIMVFIHAHLPGSSWGLAIVLLTVVIRAVLVPLTFRQLRSMQEMQRLAPEINKLKEKYKDDKQRQQQEIMKFYQAHKINPLASCLPLLLQLPVFISLFYMLRTDLKLDICGRQLKEFYTKELKTPILTDSQIPQKAVKVPGHTVTVPAQHTVTAAGHAVTVPAHTVTTAGHTVKGLAETGCNLVAPGSAKFLFIPDITAKATGVALIVLIVLYVGSQVISTLVATATADPNQRRLLLLLPVVFVVILYRYPAGLLVYWITTNLWTIGQQYFIRQRMPPPAPPPAPAKGSPNGKTDSGLKPALAGAGVAGVGGANPGGSTPPRPPRKKKKRSGRRR